MSEFLNFRKRAVNAFFHKCLYFIVKFAFFYENSNFPEIEFFHRLHRIPMQGAAQRDTLLHSAYRLAGKHIA